MSKPKEEVDREKLNTWLQNRPVMTNTVFVGCDLREHDDFLANLPQALKPEDGCVFLGCQLGPRVAAAAAGYYGLVFPCLPGRTYDPFRTTLYTVEELFNGFNPLEKDSYLKCMDWNTYRSYLVVDDNNNPVKPSAYVKVGADELMARRLHDHFISDELTEYLKPFAPKKAADGTNVGGKGVVAIMGGHDRKRKDADYSEIALMARELTRAGYLVATGGGPGLMEAANLGAWFADHTAEELLGAIATMAQAPDTDVFRSHGWLKAAWEIREKFKPANYDKCRSLGIPTWFYGHEPPNVFATTIAKYFENSIREEGLLAVATHGVIFAVGSGGTTQEIFQDACQNYYETYGKRSPMLLYKTITWNPTPEQMSDDKNSDLYDNKPAWPLLSKLARMKGFTDLIKLVDTGEQALSIIEEAARKDFERMPVSKG